MTIRIINFALILISLMAIGCGQKKCQQPATEKIQHVSDQPWRLVETTDSSDNFKSLSNTTFLVYEFANNYTGNVKKVENNNEFENPVAVFNYNIDPESQVMRILYSNPNEDTSSSSSDSKTAKQSGSKPLDYGYDLGRELEMYDYSSGAYYRFVPYQGIIAPDEKCTF